MRGLSFWGYQKEMDIAEGGAVHVAEDRDCRLGQDRTLVAVQGGAEPRRCSKHCLDEVNPIPAIQLRVGLGLGRVRVR